MYKFYDALLNPTGDALVGYLVRLFAADGSQVALYADESSTPIISVSGVADAAKSDDEGMVRFYVVSGEYDLRTYDSNDVYIDVETSIPMFRGITDAEATAFSASATASAATASTKADIATTQAGIAFAASTSATASAAAALAAAGITAYADTAAGLAATALGDTFWVDQGDGTGKTYRHDAGPVATLIGTFILDITDDGAAGLVGYQAGGAGSVLRNVAAKAGERSSFADMGVPLDGSDGTAAMEAAIAASRHVVAGEGNYYGHDIAIGVDHQNITGNGIVNVLRNANGALVNTAAADLTIEGISFRGEDPAYTGDVLTFTGPRLKLLFCSSRDAGSDNVLKITGSSFLVLGNDDVWDGNVLITSDGGGTANLYGVLSGVRINGLLTINDVGFMGVSNCLLASGLDVYQGAVPSSGSHGPKIDATRIVGPLTIRHSATTVGAGTSVSGNVVIGDGATAYSNIIIDPSFTQSGGFTFEIKALVKGTFHLGNVYASGNAITIPDSVRQTCLIYHGQVDWTPVISGDSGSFTLGDGTLQAKFSQNGNIITARVRLVIGSTTALPTGGLYCNPPVAWIDVNTTPIHGRVTITDSGTPWTGIVRGHATKGVVGYFTKDAAADAQMSVTSPVALAAGDTVEWIFSYVLPGL